MSKEYEANVVKELTDMVNEGLYQFGLGPLSTAKLLNLSENATFYASDPADGNEIIIRVGRSGYSSKEEISSEMVWVQALIDEKVLNTANPVKTISNEYVATMHTKSGQERMVVAFEKLEGSQPDVGQANILYWFELIGEVTAKLHKQAKSWKKPEWFTRRFWDYDGIIGEHAFWGSWKDAIGLTSDGYKIVEKALAKVKPIIDNYGITKDNFGVIHSDIRSTNLLLHEDKVQIIDFDDMGYGWYLFDCAATLSFMEESEIAPDLLKAWIKGYEKVTKLSDYEKSLLPTFSILRRIELMAWCSSHNEIPFCQRVSLQCTKDTEKLCEKYLSDTYLV